MIIVEFNHVRGGLGYIAGDEQYGTGNRLQQVLDSNNARQILTVCFLGIWYKFPIFAA